MAVARWVLEGPEGVLRRGKWTGCSKASQETWTPAVTVALHGARIFQSLDALMARDYSYKQTEEYKSWISQFKIRIEFRRRRGV